MKSVQGKKVLITGGAMGLGRLFAERAIAERAETVVLWDVNETALNDTLADLHGADTEVVGYIVDLASADDIAATAAEVLEEIGTMDIVINNAGIVRGNTYFWESDPVRDTRATIEVNTLAPMYVAHEFLPSMIAAPGRTHLVNLASAAGFTPNPRMAAYASSKWAVVGWSDSVRLELKQAGHEHVGVTTVCPYYIRTGMFDGVKSAPLLPILDPADVVEETWKGMLAGSPFVVLPKTVMLNEMLKGVLPIGVRDFIADHVIGVYHTMEDFTGRVDTPAAIEEVREQAR
ncbi:MAG: SDR family oxidoreductase [Actinomycetia bacterium]|nr:SDR family oxidoreductase [Actinomycetes bacterium]